MNKKVSKIICVISILLFSVPLAMLATFLLVPFWRWLEADTGIESIGHSGPAEWCYALVYLVIVISSLAVYFKRSAK